MMLENIRVMDDLLVDNSNLVESINACRQGFSPSFGLIKSALSQTKAGRLKSCAAECSRLLSQVGIWHWRHLIQPQTQRISCLIDAILSIPLHSLPTFGPLFPMQLPAWSTVLVIPSADAISHCISFKLLNCQTYLLNLQNIFSILR